MIFWTYAVLLKSDSGPTSCQRWGSVWLKFGPRANPSAGSPNAALARPPTARAPPVMRPRRVTVSPANAPGMFRSAVYGDFLFRGAGAIAGVGLYRDAFAQRP